MSLPSSALRPRLTNYQIYEGFRYEQAQINNRNRDASILDRKFVPHKMNVEVKFDVATGVPLPEDQALRDIASRHVYVSLFDLNTKQIIGNSCRLQAKWDQAYEDRWTFKLAKGVAGMENYNNSFIVRYANFDPSKDANLAVCIEFCLGMRIRDANQGESQFKQKLTVENYQMTSPDFEVSCCYGLLRLMDLTSSGQKTVQLHGGSPIRELAIGKEDIKARRTGWRSVVKAITKSISSSLKLEVIRSFPMDQVNCFSVLPDNIIFLKSSLLLLKTYREFAASRSLRPDLTINASMHNLIEVQTLCKCVDCPDILPVLSAFWSVEVAPKITSYLQELHVFSLFMQSLNLLFYHKGFRFKASDPSAAFYAYPEIVASRQELLKQTLLDVKSLSQIDRPPAGKKPAANKSTDMNTPSIKSMMQLSGQFYDQFNVSDILSDDEESDFEMMKSYLLQKNKKKLKEIGN